MAANVRRIPLPFPAAVILPLALSLGAVSRGFGAAGPSWRVPILVYHRFAATPADSMTVTTETFESHLRALADEGVRVIPLRELVECLRHAGACPAERSVVITADDGHRSVYSDMLPLVRRYAVPVTLFVYPSAVSRADYALGWDQLRGLIGTGLFEVQAHTWWHPDFRAEKRERAPADYARFVDGQLRRSRERLARELGTPIDLLAWPFGIHDPDLDRRAAALGYAAAFTLEPRPVGPSDDLMALPRYLMSEGLRGRAFARLLGAARAGRAP
jgi:peptidoglycan/xylan/chitin deacetylase (PgdA/CDA1 family)